MIHHRVSATLQCAGNRRAWDGSAAQQPSVPAAVWNPKGYVNTSWARSAVRVR